MSKQGILQLFRPAHKVPQTIWSSDRPLNVRPKLSTILALVSGLWIFGTGEAILIDAGIGVSPWTVLAQGISKQVDLTVGMATFVVSFLVLFLWIPLRETPGIGTILNAILIAMSIDVMRPFIPDQTDMSLQIIQASIGIILVGVGSALYLTANLGPGPGPIFARHDKEIDIPSIKVKEGSKYKVNNAPKRKIIIKIKKNTPTFLNNA